jgi:glucose-6-phosphate isomerase
MIPKINPTTTKAWAALQLHAAEMHKTSLKKLFSKEADRFQHLSIRDGNILFDYSKNIVNQNIKPII